MSNVLTRRLIAALTLCPCCRARPTYNTEPAERIPDHCTHEVVFDCGAAVFVTNSGDYEGGRPCPGPLDWKLDELHQQVLDAEEMEGVAP